VKNTYEAILFDLGDTLINFGKVDKTDAIKQAARISYDFLKSIGQPVGSFRVYFIRNLLEIRLRCIWSDITGKDFDSFSVMQSIGRKNGYNLSRRQWLVFNWLWYKPLASLAYIEPDLRASLQQLKDMGLRLGILSNTFVGKEALNRHLEEIGVLDMFELLMYSCYHEYRKPDKRIFLDAAAELGLPPQKILFVGDRLDTDVAGSLAAGMGCVVKKSHANEGKKLPHGAIRIDAISQLPNCLRERCRAL
jgi:putative hydrolase of the HAD superfamily